MGTTDVVTFLLAFIAILLILLRIRSKKLLSEEVQAKQAAIKFSPALLNITVQQSSIPPPMQEKTESNTHNLIDEENHTSWHGLNPYWIIRTKKHILSHGYSYPPIICSFISYLALYCIPKEIQTENSALYLFVQYAMLSILPALVIFELRPTKLVKDIFGSWIFSSALLYIFFGLGTSIILMSGLGLVNTFAFLVHLAIALLISARLVGLSVVVIISIGIVIFYKAFSEMLGHVITSDMSVPFLIGYWMLLLSSVYISFVRYHYTKQLIKKRPSKLWKKNIYREEHEKTYEARENM